MLFSLPQAQAAVQAGPRGQHQLLHLGAGVYLGRVGIRASSTPTHLAFTLPPCQAHRAWTWLLPCRGQAQSPPSLPSPPSPPSPALTSPWRRHHVWPAAQLELAPFLFISWGCRMWHFSALQVLPGSSCWQQGSGSLLTARQSSVWTCTHLHASMNTSTSTVKCLLPASIQNFSCFLPLEAAAQYHVPWPLLTGLLCVLPSLSSQAPSSCLAEPPVK